MPRHNTERSQAIRERNKIVAQLTELGILQRYISEPTGITEKTIEGINRRDRQSKGDPGGHGAGGVPDVVLAAGWIDKKERSKFNAMVDRAKPAVEKALKGESDG